MAFRNIAQQSEQEVSVTFEQFAMEHGLIINSLILDKWVRVPTEDHPRKRNGAYIFDGHKGAVINFALHTQHILYKSAEPYVPDPMAAIRRMKAEKERRDRQKKAADKAAFILNNATKEQHPYLLRKGFDCKGYVWNGLLVLPMRVNGALVGCQLIQADGTKRFLAGQVTKGASLVIDNKGVNILCEGFATGLSVRNAMRHLRERYTIHVCFSAGNMLEVAKGMRNPVVIADNDASGTGQSVAKKIASRYWLGQIGEDFNDAEQRIGTAAVADSLLPFIPPRQ
jgi:putative DNA primase/helicase